MYIDVWYKYQSIQNIPVLIISLDELPALLNQEDASLEEDGTDDQDVDAVVWGIIYVRFWVCECECVCETN